jgi:hypothetical protein
MQRSGRDSTVGTYEALRSAIEDAKVWSRAGSIELEVHDLQDTFFHLLSQDLRELLKDSSRYVVTLNLPVPFFEDLK